MKNSNSNIYKKNLRCEYNIIKKSEVCNCINRIPSDDRTKMASLQIFAYIVLRAWRKSSKQNRELLLSMDDLRKCVSKSIIPKKCEILNFKGCLSFN